MHDPTENLAHDVHAIYHLLSEEFAVRRANLATKDDLHDMELRLTEAIRSIGVSAEDGKLLDALLAREKKAVEKLEALDASTPAK